MSRFNRPGILSTTLATIMGAGALAACSEEKPGVTATNAVAEQTSKEKKLAEFKDALAKIETDVNAFNNGKGLGAWIDEQAARFPGIGFHFEGVFLPCVPDFDKIRENLDIGNYRRAVEMLLMESESRISIFSRQWAAKNPNKAEKDSVSHELVGIEFGIVTLASDIGRFADEKEKAAIPSK